MSGLSNTFQTSSLIDIVNSHDNDIGNLKYIAIHVNSFISQVINLGQPTEDWTYAIQAGNNYLRDRGGGDLILSNAVYRSRSFTVDKNVSIIGQCCGDIYNTNCTKLKFIGTGTFITVNSMYHSRGKIRKLRVEGTAGDRTPTNIGIAVKSTDNSWGGCALVEDAYVEGFGVGIQHYITYNSVVDRTTVRDCGVCIGYVAEIPNVAPVQYNLCNLNTISNSTIVSSDIGVKYISSQSNNVINTDFENLKIGVQVVKSPTAILAPSTNNFFTKCWFEGIAKYNVCNYDIDVNFNAVNSNQQPLPKFNDCSSDFKLFPEIPTFESIANTFRIKEYLTNNQNQSQYFVDDDIKTLYNRPIHYKERVVVGNNAAHREIHSVSNKGTIANVSFNTWETSKSVNAVGLTEQSLDIIYSDIINTDSSFAGANPIASVAFINVKVVYSDAKADAGSFMVNDTRFNTASAIFTLGIAEQVAGSHLANYKMKITPTIVNFNNNKLTVFVNATDIAAIYVKLVFVPMGMMVTN